MSDMNGRALFRLGFRPFFLFSGLIAVLTMAVWMLETVFSVQLIASIYSASFYHAHEMIYGYGLAVVAGFLLTAVKNWTGIQTLQGRGLQALLLLWVVARLAPFVESQQAMLLGAVCDGLFILGLCIALTLPVVQAKLWKNMAVVSKLYFFLIGQVLYTLDQFYLFEDGRRIGIYIGFYMILSLLLVLSRRVIPMFIERGVDESVSMRNDSRVDMACFVLFLVFVIADIFFVSPMLTASLAGLLAVLHATRLSGWYSHGIWRKPLLWVLYVAYIWVIVGFALKCAVVIGMSPLLALHAFAVGGIGMMSLGMMCRVSLGHTGRSMMQAPTGVCMMFLLLLIGVCIRVVFPILWVDHSLLWLGLSQACWIAAFGLFLYLYTAILIKPRIDGKWG